MIYLSKKTETEVITDNIINFIPSTLDVYLDDVLIGKFNNLSNDINLLKFIVPIMVMEEKEYILTIFNETLLIKQELIIIKDLEKPFIKSITKTNNIKMYERE